jgi:hypothetical protein
MTLQDFVNFVKGDGITDARVKEAWSKLCNALLNQEVDAIRGIIEEGGIDGLVEIEIMDGFGTEGMKL